MKGRRLSAWLVVALTAGIVAGTGILDTTSHGLDPGWGLYVFPLAVAMSTGVGVVLATRLSRNPIGWLLLANGLVLAVAGFAEGYAAYGTRDDGDLLTGAAWAVLYDQKAWPLLFAPFAAIAFVFPDGRLPSPRWRAPATVAGASLIAMLVLGPFSSEPFDAPYRDVANPLPALSGPLYELPFVLAGVGMVAGLIASGLAVRTRLRRSEGLERRQIKLLAYAALLVPATLIACWIEALITGKPDVAVGVGLVLMAVLIPLAIGVAVMRHRLYDVDRVVNRTLVYLVLTGLLAATYAVVALAIGVAVGAGSTLPTAAGTLAVALAFGTLRSRVQMLVDRRFSRARYDGLRQVEHHLAELRAGRAAPETTGAVLAKALGDPSLELFFWLPGSDVHVDAAGRLAEPAPDATRDLTPVRRGTLRLGAVLHDRSLSEQPDVLVSVIDAAGLAIEIARLRAEVARRLAEVQQSRARIVTAGYEERRRLERDLHDGAQQRLVSIGLAMRNVQRRLPADDGGARDALDRTVDELTVALEELRELARGVRPGCLDDGLAAALRELASRSPLKTEVAATGERFEERIEAAAYFVASEALTNSAKHANASQVLVTAERRNGTLVLSVRDDGRGGAQPSERSGLAGISDRVAALGGSVQITSPPGQGTEVVAELPCES
jgi:signal transduction histidine kinase